MRRTTFSQGIGALPFLALLFRAMCMVGRLVARHASRSSSRRALVCCQHLPPTHTSRISHALEAQLTAAVPLVLHSTDEAEAVCGINIMRNLTSEHVKPKVCNHEAPSNCRSSRSALLPCALLTSTDLQVLLRASSLAQKELRSIVPTELGYRADVGAVGGRRLVLDGSSDVGGHE